MRNGYKTVYFPEHQRADSSGCVYEHIVVAEKKLGRSLYPEEVVHHIDHNRGNNDPDNLMVFASSADHTAFHKGNNVIEVDGVYKSERKQNKCPLCGKIYTPCNSNQRYCSHLCANIANQKVGESTLEIIELLLSNNGNFTATAKQLGITSNAIANRLKRNNLPYHSKNYKGA